MQGGGWGVGKEFGGVGAETDRLTETETETETERERARERE